MKPISSGPVCPRLLRFEVIGEEPFHRFAFSLPGLAQRSGAGVRLPMHFGLVPRGYADGASSRLAELRVQKEITRLRRRLILGFLGRTRVLGFGTPLIAIGMCTHR